MFVTIKSLKKQSADCRNRKIVGLLTKEAFTSSISATHFLKEIYIWVVSDDNSRGKSQDAFSFSNWGGVSSYLLLREIARN